MDDRMTRPDDFARGRLRQGSRGIVTAAWRGLRRLVRALDDHWLGDLIGVASLFGLLWIGLVAGWVLE